MAKRREDSRHREDARAAGTTTIGTRRRWRRMVQDAGAAAVAVHGRTAAQSYSGSADWDLVARIADDLPIPVFGSGDCHRAASRSSSRMRVGRRRACWSAGACCAIRGFSRRRRDLAAGRPLRPVTLEDRGQLPARLHRSADARAAVERRTPRALTRTIAGSSTRCARSASWYTKGLDNGSHLRTADQQRRFAAARCAADRGVFFAGQPALSAPYLSDSCVWPLTPLPCVESNRLLSHAHVTRSAQSDISVLCR